jgi:hypothetical protein
MYSQSCPLLLNRKIIFFLDIITRKLYYFENIFIKNGDYDDYFKDSHFNIKNPTATRIEIFPDMYLLL